MAIEQAAIIFQYKLDKLVQVFENDNDLITLLKSEEIYIDAGDEEGIPDPERIAQYEDILTIFINNSEEIADTTITELLLIDSIRDLIDSAFYQSVSTITDEMYRQLLFTFKYSTIKTFFKENYSNFMPSYDATVINNSEKLKLWQEAFMQEFDRFAQIINDISDINNIDTVAEEYLDYIAQLVGFERGDTNLGDSLFREITKNIIEVYRIKGTNYSFELFFNFIGFEIDVIEYWFDKRFYLNNSFVNPYTKETSPFKFAYYLTPNKPTDVVPENMPTPFTIMDNDIIEIRNGLTFDKDLSALNDDDEESTLTEKLERYLDISGTPDTDMNYTYFKTNVVEYSISKISSDDIPEGLTKEDETTIQSYTNFLTPIFVSKKVVINITPFEDDASSTLVYVDHAFDMRIYDGFVEILTKYIGRGAGWDDTEEEELWGLDYIDNMSTKHIEELNIWKADYADWDDLKDIQDLPLYNDISETLSSFNISYPYIENKTNTNIDFTLESSSDNLMIDSEFYNDIMYMTVQSTHYTGAGIAISSSGAASTSYTV